MRTFICLFILSLFLFILPLNAKASDDFYISLTENFKVQTSGRTDISDTIELVNQKTESYAPSITFSVFGLNPYSVAAYESGVVLPVDTKTVGEKTTFSVTFKRAVVGKGAKHRFTITFSDDSVVAKNGDTWDIHLPRVDQVDNYLNAKAILTVPSDFGELASVSTEPKKLTSNAYEFDKTSVANDILASFGKFQIYKMKLSYEAKNETDRQATKEIPLPPDTSYQKVTIQSITPSPISVRVDTDGNWLAAYVVPRRSKISITIEGNVKVTGDPVTRITSEQELTSTLSPQKYWETGDSKIKQLIGQGITNPSAIYNYVTKNLTYNYDRISKTVTRQGASYALSNPTDALCSEFTDLFIALSRSSGIPSREIEGYAASADAHLTPLSLVTDVLHAWPEYWDENKKIWTQVDPTWGNTSGLDYFSKMDTKHIALVIHGSQSETPIIPIDSANIKGAIRFDHEQLSLLTSLDPLVSINQSTSFSPLRATFTIDIKNNTGEALYNLPVTAITNKAVFTDLITVLPPFGEYKHEINFPNGLFGNELPKKIIVNVGSTSTEKVVNSGVAFFSQIIFLILATLGGTGIIVLYKKYR